MKRLIFLLLFMHYLMQCSAMASQTSETAILLSTFQSVEKDTNKITTLNERSAQHFKNGDNQKALLYANEALTMAEVINNKNEMANALVNIGNIYDQTGNPEALDCYQKAVKIYKEVGDLKSIASTCSSIGFCYEKQANYHQAIFFYEEAMKIYHESEDQMGLARTYRRIGVTYNKQGNFTEAMRYYRIGLKISEEAGDKVCMAQFYSEIGANYDKQANYTEAINYFLKAFKIREEIGDEMELASSYYNLGIVNNNLDNHEEALKHHLKALSIYEKCDRKLQAAVSDNQVGETYYYLGDYTNALKYCLQGLKTGEDYSAPKFIASCSENIARIYSKQGKYEEALKYHLKSLEVSLNIGDRFNTAKTYINLGNDYYSQGDYTNALIAQKSGLAFAREIGSKRLAQDSYRFMADTYYHLHKPDSTYYYFNLYAAMKDSVMNEEKSHQVNEMKIKYETEKKDKEITMLNLENERKQSELVLSVNQRKIAELNFQNEQQQRQLVTSENDRNKQFLLLSENFQKQQQDSISHLSVQKTLMSQLAFNERNKRNYAITGGFGMAALLSLVFYQLHRRRETKNTLTTNQLKNKVLRSQLNPHFIFHALNSIRNYIEHHPEMADTYLLKFSTLMRQVLENSDEEMISLSEEIAMLENYMQLEAIRFSHGFDYEVVMDESMDADSLMVPPLILQPMIENAILHGLMPLNKRGKIMLRFTEKNGLLEATIEDNGAGCDSTLVKTLGSEKKRSMGMQITRDRIELLNRKARAKGWLAQRLFEQGSQVEIAIPLG